MIFDVAEWKFTIGAGAQGAHLLWQLREESESGSDSCGGWVCWIRLLEMSFLVEFLINSTMLKSDDSGGFLWFLEQISEGFMNIVLVQVWRMFSVTSGAGRWQLWATWRLTTFSRECNKWRKDPSYGNNKPSRSRTIILKLPSELSIYRPVSTIFVHYIFFVCWPTQICYTWVLICYSFKKPIRWWLESLVLFDRRTSSSRQTHIYSLWAF